jgi:cobalt/nickel transport system ATP-binding protein
MTDPVLVLSDVTVRHQPGAEPALRSVSLALAPGERVALPGLNGSGKTTLLSATVGLVPHEGEISVCGLRVEPRSLAELRGHVGFLFNVPEDQLLFPKVVDDVAFGLLRRGVSRAEAKSQALVALEALGAAELGEAALHRLSHGQKQRVALAGALVTRPPLLLLDEPSAGLDPPGKQTLAAHLRQLPAAMLVATHDLAFARRVCQRYLLLERGRVAREGADLAEIARRWNEP